MPIFKGIKLTIVSQWELKIHPEFPHPDCSSQFTNRKAATEDNAISPDINSWHTSEEESKSDKILGREESSISCYIPSLPGARFWIRYNVEEAAAKNSSFYYFKLIMNGRHITSWGINTITEPSGQVIKALFDPSERWNYQHAGIVYKNNGTEMRSFFFNNKEEALSAANDGGLIEVLIYRAFGRQRKLPEPVNYRPQDEYGIVMPTGGLLDKPQDAKFYDYHLADPKDKPFATFKFHYRSWETLNSQELIPSNYPQQLLMPSASIMSLNGNPNHSYGEFLHPRIKNQISHHIKDIEDNILKESFPMEARNSFSPTCLDTTRTGVIPVNTTEVSEFAVIKDSYIPVSGSPRALSPSAESEWFSEGPESPRPLPELPVVDKTRPSTAPFNNALASSEIPSIYSSPISSPCKHITREPISLETNLGNVAVIHKVVTSLSVFNDHQSARLEREKYEKTVFNTNESPLFPQERSPTENKERMSIASPSITTGSLTSRNLIIQNKRSSTLEIRPTITDDEPLVVEDSMLIRASDDHEKTDDITSISLIESDWMCRTPSPIRDDSEDARIEKLWSPGVNRKRTSRGISHKAKDWYENASRPSSTKVFSNSVVDGTGSRITSGNWI